MLAKYVVPVLLGCLGATGVCAQPNPATPTDYDLTAREKKQILRTAKRRGLLSKDKTAGLRLSKDEFIRVEIGSDSLRQNEGTQVQVKYGVRF